jgi:hypothetical protein
MDQINYSNKEIMISFANKLAQEHLSKYNVVLINHSYEIVLDSYIISNHTRSSNIIFTTEDYGNK